MITRQFRPVLLTVCMLVSVAKCFADIPRDVVAQGKRASALVETAAGSVFGSAFCINPSGYFIASAHLLPAHGKPGVTLVLNAGEKDQVRLDATIVRRDSELDLALLNVKPPRLLTALPLGAADGLLEAQGTAAFGFPVGRDLTRAEFTYSGISLNTAHIASLRNVNGVLAAFQLDVALKPGNSGGPVIDSKGKVIGVVTVVAGANETGGSSVIPVNVLKRFLDRADVILTPPIINTANAHVRMRFAIHVSTYPTVQKGLSVEFTLNSGLYNVRTVTASRGENGEFTAEASPLPASNSQHELRLTVVDSQSKVACTAPDQAILVGGKRVYLSALRTIEPGKKAIITLANGSRQEDTVEGLEAVDTRVLGVVTRQNLSRASRITIEDMDSLTSSVAYHIVVRQAGREIGELHGELMISGSHAPRVVSKWADDLEVLICCYFSNSVKRFNARTGAFIDDYISGHGLNGPTAIAVGPDGNLYVTGGESQTVHRFDGRTGQFMDIFVPRDATSRMNAPNGMDFGPDGNLYVGSFNSREVKRFNGQTGQFIDTFVPPGSGGLNQPGYLMFAPDGNMLIASVAGRAIKHYDGKTGAYLGDFLKLEGNTNPNAFCLGPEGRFYVCCYRSKSIQRFDGKTGAFIDNFIVAEGLHNREPVGIAFGPDANLYVSTRADEVLRFNGETGEFMDTFLSGSDMRFPQYMIFRQIHKSNVIGDR